MRFIRHTTYLWITQVLIMKFTQLKVWRIYWIFKNLCTCGQTSIFSFIVIFQNTINYIISPQVMKIIQQSCWVGKYI